MKFDLLHPADQLVMIMDRIYKCGMTTTSGGNLSIMDDDGDLWITPSGIDKGNLTRADMIRVKPDGTVIGIHKPSVELPFHRMIYARRPDLKAIVHAHPPTLIAFSLVRRVPNIRLFPNVYEVCGNIGVAKYHVPGSTALGESIADEFEKGYNTVLLENHGIVCASGDLFRAFMAFETLDFCGRLEIDAAKIGVPKTLNDEELQIDKAGCEFVMDEFDVQKVSAEEREGRRSMCELIHRAYDQKLFTSTQGTFSMRLSDGSFLITPYNKDRKYLEPEDIVRIRDGMCERGKIPSRAALLHMEIYKRKPEIHSVINAHPPAIMAFAVTDAEFDSRTIPESYVSLRYVKRLPYGISRLDIPATAESFTSAAPAAIVSNQCVIVTGNSLLNTYDRLEVLEYSAAAMIASLDIGKIALLTPKEIETLEKTFSLNG